MAIWYFDTFDIEQLDRLVEIDSELQSMGLDGLDEDMMAEVSAEIDRRLEDAEEPD